MTYNLDTNHDEIVGLFKKLGCKVVDNARVKRADSGQLDVWIGFPNPWGGMGRWVWVEIKHEDNTTTPGQKREIKDSREHGLPAFVVSSSEDVDNLYHLMLKDMDK